MGFRIFLLLLLAVAPLLTPLAAHAAIPFFGPIIPTSSNQCAASWGLVMLVINNVISFLITIVIVFVAPLMIAYSGFLFVVNPVKSDGIQQAKGILAHMVVGIVFALASWMIVDAVMAVLYNPSAAGGTWSSLVTSSEPVCLTVAGSLNQATTTPMAPITVGVQIPAGEQAIRDLLKQYGVSINKPSCTADQMTGPVCGTAPGPSCTNVAGMQGATVQQIINIANTCGNRPGFNPCGVQVTGGTEPGHACGAASHERGSKVDISQTALVNEYIQKFPKTGTRGGDSGGDIRKDSCGNEYVQESNHWDITVKSACGLTGGGSPAPVCPSDGSARNFELKLSGADRLIMPSGQIASAVLPGVREAGGPVSSGQIVFGESTVSPKAATIEISVSKCRGVIDASDQKCYLTTENGSLTTLTWLEEPIGEAAEIYGLCQAYLANGPHYVNVRYTYQASDCSLGQCGFVNQWNFGAF